MDQATSVLVHVFLKEPSRGFSKCPGRTHPIKLLLTNLLEAIVQILDRVGEIACSTTLAKAPEAADLFVDVPAVTSFFMRPGGLRGTHEENLDKTTHVGVGIYQIQGDEH
jgi:hypothetical protein